MAHPDRLRSVAPEQKQPRAFFVRVLNPLTIRKYAQRGEGVVLSKVQFDTPSGHHEIFLGGRTVLRARDETPNSALEKNALITTYMQLRRGMFISDKEAHEIESMLKQRLGCDEMTSIYYGKDETGKQTVTVRRNDLYAAVDLGYHNDESRKESAVINGEYIKGVRIHLVRYYGPKESREAFSYLFEADEAKFTEALDFYALCYSAVMNALCAIKKAPVPDKEIVLQGEKAL